MTRLLSTWKDIANFIGKHKKTAKRYAKKYGMPIRKGPGNSVFGIPSEIQRWLELFDEAKKK